MTERRPLVIIDGNMCELPTGDTVPNLLPRISYTGELGVGTVLTCHTPFVDAAFQWRRDGTDISGATSQAYTVTSDDDGAEIDCDVTGTILRTSAVLIPIAPSYDPGFPAKPTSPYLAA